MDFEGVIKSIPVEPYYLDLEYGQVIYCSDCRLVLPHIPDKSIDLSIAAKRCAQAVLPLEVEQVSIGGEP